MLEHEAQVAALKMVPPHSRTLVLMQPQSGGRGRVRRQAILAFVETDKLCDQCPLKTLCLDPWLNVD